MRQNNLLYNNTKLLPFLFLIFALIIIITSIINSAIKNNKFTCNKYIFNTYLYILLSLIIVSLVVISLDYYGDGIKMIQNFSQFNMILLFIVTIFLLISTMMISPNQILLKHSVWLLYIISMGLLLFPVYIFTRYNNTLISTLLTTLTVVIVLSIFAFYKPELISLQWGTILFMLLLSGIVLSIFNLIFNKNDKYNLSFWLSYGFIVLFSFFILYDTKKLQVNAKNCIQADYINESIGLFLDIINLFTNIAYVSR